MSWNRSHLVHNRKDIMTEQLIYELFFIAMLFGLIALRVWNDKK